MGRLARWCLLLGIFLFSSGCKAFIYELFVLRRWNGALGRYQYFIGLSDFHDKSNLANREQLHELQEMLNRCSPDVVTVGSEDISSANTHRSGLCGRFSVHSRGSILGGFAKACRSIGLDFQNFEYRYCRVAALGPVLNNLEGNIRQFSSVRDTRVSALIREVENVFAQLRSYQDDQLLRDFYERCIIRVKGQMKILGLYDHADMTVADYLEKMTTPGNRLNFLKRLFTFDSVLLDLKMLHSVIAQRNKVTYLVLAGGSHTSRVAQMLAKLGYELVHSTRPQFKREYNMRKCLGSHIINGQYCRKPTPISLHDIRDFL